MGCGQEEGAFGEYGQKGSSHVWSDRENFWRLRRHGAESGVWKSDQFVGMSRSAERNIWAIKVKPEMDCVKGNLTNKTEFISTCRQRVEQCSWSSRHRADLSAAEQKLKPSVPGECSRSIHIEHEPDPIGNIRSGSTTTTFYLYNHLKLNHKKNRKRTISGLDQRQKEGSNRETKRLPTSIALSTSFYMGEVRLMWVQLILRSGIVIWDVLYIRR